MIVGEDQVRAKHNRRGFGLKKVIQKDLETDYHSEIVDRIRENGHVWTEGDLTFYLAQSFGFCYGVDRAVELAYETRKQFPDRRIFLTTEIIHNPQVNQNLRDMGIRFLNGPYRDPSTSIETLTPEDVVIIPAFGTDMEALNSLYKTQCVLVDTICGSVLHVWKRVESYARDRYTAVIHGKWKHEETQATSSRLCQFDHGRYLVVLNKEEAARVCDYIVRGGDREAFLKSFASACSRDFDPDVDLEKIGFANQTTMLSSESLEISEMLRRAISARDSGDAAKFRTFDTICSATQDRQNAVLELLKKDLDVMVVIGGYNSSNTTHLSEMAAATLPTYHINGADCILSAEEIRHRRVGEKEERIARDWLPKGEVKIGVTAGASTPNQEIGKVVEHIISLRV